jgi:hypothetical protein
MTRPGPILLAIIFTATAVVLTVPLLIYEQPAPAGQKTAAPAPPAPPKPASPKSPPPAATAQVFAGKVVAVEEPAGQSDDRGFALKADDGTTHPLVADDVSRMFRLYPQLRDRPVTITGRLLPGTKDLKVEFVKTIKNGKPFVVDFWCEVCQISHQQPGPCVCCGDELELRERPAP